MRCFIRKLILAFVLVVISFLGVLLILLKKERHSYLKDITLSNDGKSVICVSDSITVYSLNPQFWPELVNLSSEASPMDVQLMKLEDILTHNPNRIQTVLLDVSLLRMAGEREHPVLNADYEGSKFFPLYYWHRRDNPLYAIQKHPLKMASNWMRYKCGNLVKGKARSELVQGYLRRDVSRISSHYNLEDKEAVGYAKMCNGNMGQEIHNFWSVRVLREMIALCQKHEAKVCLITLPLNQLILDKLNPDTLAAFDSILDDLSKEYHTQLLNYLQEKLDDNCFININHLNYKGGIIITEKLKSSVKHNISYP